MWNEPKLAVLLPRMHAKSFFSLLSNHSKPVIRALEDYISAPVMLLLNFAEKYMRNIGTFMKEIIIGENWEH